MKDKDRLFTAFAVHLFFSITLIICGPYEMFLSNLPEFTFAFADVWWIQFLMGCAYIAIMTMVSLILPKKLSLVELVIEFLVTICCYIQTMFLNGKLRIMVGYDISFDSSTKILNLLVWLAIFTGVGIGLLKLKDYKRSSCIRYISLFISAIQVVGLVALLFTTEGALEHKTGFLSQKNRFVLAPENNTIVFITDYFDGEFMQDILQENPEFLQPLDGFTYYPNTTSVHSRTYPSVPYFMTGEKCYFDKLPKVWVDEATKNNPFIQQLAENNIDIGLYTENSYIGDSAKSLIGNWKMSKVKLEYLSMFKQMERMVMYRDLPYIVKKKCEFYTYYINTLMSFSDTEEKIYINFDDEDFMKSLDEEKLQISDFKGTYRFYHLGGCHLTLYNPSIGGKKAFEIINDYLDQLRELGLYENATVIIMSDHGSSGGGDTLDLPQGACVPLLIVKKAGEANTQIKVSEAPVSQTEFIPTVLKSYGMSCDRPAFDEIEDGPRERYYYYTALYGDSEGEVELREYLVDGDARLDESYHFTGKTWPVQYSMNIVKH